MHRVGRWLDRGRVAATASTQSLDSFSESQNLETALRAVELIMDDDIDGAEKGLADGNSAFHKLARGTLAFMRATLGFEQEVMKDAADTLYEAEYTASTSLYRAQHSSNAFHSNIYEKGAEFMLCQAESQVMTAVVGVLNESLTESIKGFYKLRKAYMTLDSLTQMEVDFMKTRGVQSLASSRSTSTDRLTGGAATSLSSIASPANAPEDAAQVKQPSALRNAKVVGDKNDDSDSDSEEFYDADTINASNLVLDKYAGMVEKSDSDEQLSKELEASEIHERPTSTHENDLKLSRTATLGMLSENADSEIFSNSLDVFIHSGTNLMFGVLNLMISIVPPAFSRLLFIVGFRGDRDRGIRMLWQASKFSNVNGGMAGLVIFGWYNGLVGFCDIIPDNNLDDPNDTAGYPAVRLQGLLAEMRQRYPKSYLWLIEEARMASARKDLSRALELLQKPGRSKMKQLEALHTFEMTLDSMYDHQYQLCADSFLKCVDLNAWSQALYYYISAAAHLAAYRESPNSEKAGEHKRLAEECFRTAPTKVGKKKMMGRQLPFDVFVVRKLAKWEERATRFSCSFIDAIGVSPIEEMIYLWGGFKKMGQDNLEKSLKNLAWSEQHPRWHEEDADEPAIMALLRGAILRNLRLHDESMEILRVKLIDQDHQMLKGQNRDDWPAPAAHHEMAVNLWMQRTGYIRQHGADATSGGEHHKPALDLKTDAQLVQQAKMHIERAKNWEKYELDARLGMKITAALNAIRGWEQKHLTVQ
jgi:Protein of unknown function (DUF3808)